MRIDRTHRPWVIATVALAIVAHDRLYRLCRSNRPADRAAAARSA